MTVSKAQESRRASLGVAIIDPVTAVSTLMLSAHCAA